MEEEDEKTRGARVGFPQSLGGPANIPPPYVHAPRPPNPNKQRVDSSDSPTTCTAPPPPGFRGDAGPSPAGSGWELSLPLLPVHVADE